MLYSKTPASYLFAAVPWPSQTSSQILGKILRGLVNIALFLINGCIGIGHVLCGSYFVNISITAFRVANVPLALELCLCLNVLVSCIFIYYIS